MDEKKIEYVGVPIEWHIPEGFKSQYATNLVVQHTDQEFIISFFEVKQPIVLGSPDEIKSTYEKMESVKAECVSRIIVSPKRMEEFIEVMKKNLEKFRSKVKEERKTDEPTTH